MNKIIIMFNYHIINTINGNNLENNSEMERNDAPSENEINEPSPSGDNQSSEIKKDNNIDNSSENERNDIPSENEIYKPSPSGDSQSNEIKNEENEESNNMEGAPAPDLYDEEV